MEAKNYRIGNWMVYPKWHKDGSDRYFMARELYLENKHIGLTDGIIQTQVTSDSVEPVKLTEEWLIKLGFTKNQNVLWVGMANIKAELHVEMYPRGMVFIIRGDFTELILDTIKYVHELQNLFFALTSTELQLKNKG